MLAGKQSTALVGIAFVGLAGLAGLAGICAACSFTSLGGFSSGDNGAPTGSGDGGARDGDMADQGEASAEGGSSSGGGWCTRTHPSSTRCWDFDDGRKASDLGTARGGVDIVQGVGVGGTSALRTTVPANTNPSDVADELRFDINVIPAAIDLEIALRADLPANNRYVEACVLQAFSTGGRFGVKVALDENTLRIVEDLDDANGHVLYEDLHRDLSLYTTIRAHLTTSAIPWSIDLYVDEALVKKGSLASSPPGQVTHVALRMGAYYAALSPQPKQIFVDNVFFDPK